MNLLRIFLLSALLAALAGCHSLETYDNDPRGNFEALWSIIDQRYCFFEEKDVDWQQVYARYSPLVSNSMTQRELFQVCADMLAELRDGHTNLSSAFQTSYYRRWWSDYPQNYDARLIEQHYLNFNYLTVGGIDYAVLPQNVGYMRYGSFVNPVGEGNLDYILHYMNTCSGLIIDVRDNPGGNLTNVETFVRRFITRRILAGYISHKTGPGHGDFSEPFAYYYDPAPEGRIMWGKPVVVLASRGTFSAANNFVSVMKSIPGVTVAGATTGGGSGMPFTSELPNGWGIRFSACSILDPSGLPTESGVEPTQGCAVDLDSAAVASGHDNILDFAVELLSVGVGGA